MMKNEAVRVGDMVINKVVIDEVFNGHVYGAIKEGEAGVVIGTRSDSITVLWHPEADPCVETEEMVILQGLKRESAQAAYDAMTTEEAPEEDTEEDAEPAATNHREGFFVFTITACDGRFEGEPKSWEEAHEEAAKWLGRPVERLFGSYDQQYARADWETGGGQEVRVEPAEAYADSMRAEFGDDWAEGGAR